MKMSRPQLTQMHMFVVGTASACLCCELTMSCASMFSR